jgi:hypothetical protein
MPACPVGVKINRLKLYFTTTFCSPEPVAQSPAQVALTAR